MPSSLHSHPGEGADRLFRALAAAEPEAQPLGEETVSGRVLRVRLRGGRRSSLIVKEVGREAARKTELVCSRWLPAAGLDGHGPPLLAEAPAGEGSVWQVFEDLGECALPPDPPAPDALEAATRLVARLHLAFAEPALLAGPSGELERLSERFHAEWAERAARALAAIRARGLTRERLALRDRLRRRIDALLAQVPRRTRCLREAGWPTTLLHGDLWPQNVLLPPRDERRRARLIDWDRACVGPVAYDLSTFLMRLAPRARRPALRLYGEAVAAAGWRLPGHAELNEAFDTSEQARLASCLISPAEAASEGAEWGFEDLRAVDSWFGALRPVLPTPPR